MQDDECSTVSADARFLIHGSLESAEAADLKVEWFPTSQVPSNLADSNKRSK